MRPRRYLAGRFVHGELLCGGGSWIALDSPCADLRFVLCALRNRGLQDQEWCARRLIVLVLILGSFCVLCGIGAYKIKSGALGDLGGPGMGGPPGMGGMDSVARVEQVPDEVTQDANPSASDADKSED